MQPTNESNVATTWQTHLRWSVFSCVFALAMNSESAADTWDYADSKGVRHQIEARLIHESDEWYLVALPDGQYETIHRRAVTSRRQSPGPAAMSPEEVAAELEERFGQERFRSYVKSPFVIGLVLAAPLHSSAEGRAKAFMRDAAAFLSNTSKGFLTFAQEMKIDVARPEFPLVMLIFETDDLFEAYAAEERTSNTSLSRLAGYYSHQTNFLAVRMAECNDYDTPLHEAIHQLTYNCRMVPRYAPVPRWFAEGIATGFEANRGQIRIGPAKVSSRYARLAVEAQNVTWQRLVAEDNIFGSDFLLDDAYGHAWGLHWLLVTKYSSEYAEYVKLLAKKRPLAEDTEQQREAEFIRCFGNSPEKMQGEFRTALRAGLKRQNVSLNTSGRGITEAKLAAVQTTAVSDQLGNFVVSGQIMNTSPIRPMTYLVCIETNIGTFTHWLVPNLGVGGRGTMLPQRADRVMAGALLAGKAQSYRVHVQSVLPDSTQAMKWAAGDIPVPEFNVPPNGR